MNNINVENIFLLDEIEIDKLKEKLEEKYICDGDKNVLPYLTYIYYKFNNYQISYFYGNNYNKANNIKDLYLNLSLIRMNYNNLALFNLKDKLDMIVTDFNLPLYDRILLLFSLEKYNDNLQDYVEHQSDEEIRLLYMTCLIQYKLKTTNKRSLKVKDYLIDLYEYFDDFFIKTRIGLLISTFYDINFRENLNKEQMIKCATKDSFYNVLSESDDNIQYANFFSSKIKNAYLGNIKTEDYAIISYSNVIGFSCHCLKTKEGVIIIDCGSNIKNEENEFINFKKFFSENKIYKSDIIGIVITHGHLDHVGSYNTLIKFLGLKTPPPVYLTNETYYLVKTVHKIIFENKIILDYNNEININDNLKLEFIPNGHILGSSLVVFKYKEHNIVFSGDISLHKQVLIDGFNIVDFKKKYKNIETLVLESTYGHNKNQISFDDNKIILVHLVRLLKKYNYVSFIPAFAIGRTQEILMLLLENKIDDIAVLGLGHLTCEFYQEQLDKQLIKPGVYVSNDTESTNKLYHDIIIASSGMLSKGSTSYKIFNYFLNINKQKNVALIKTGYVEENGGQKLIDKWKETKKCFDVSLSAHASYYELIAIINLLCPKNLVLVHGQGIEGIDIIK